jgi:ATP-dependent DNA ligase
MIFDLLHADGQSLLGQDCVERRSRLRAHCGESGD